MFGLDSGIARLLSEVGQWCQQRYQERKTSVLQNSYIPAKVTGNSYTLWLRFSLQINGQKTGKLGR